MRSCVQQMEDSMSLCMRIHALLRPPALAWRSSWRRAARRTPPRST
jgi:hypothetical protein